MGFVFVVLCINAVIVSSAIRLDVPFFGKSLNTGYLTERRISFLECMDYCRARPRCQSVTYKRLLNKCRLNRFAPDRYRLNDRYGVVHIHLKDYSERSALLRCGSTECSKFEVCDFEAQECRIKECQFLPQPINGYRKGGLENIGAKAMLYCNNNTYIPFTQQVPSQSHCQPDSTWSVETLSCFQESDICGNYLLSGNIGVRARIIGALLIDIPQAVGNGVINSTTSFYITPEDPYVMIVFKNPVIIVGIATQSGAHFWEGYVEQYTFAHGALCTSLRNRTDSRGNVKVFSGNNDTGTVVVNMLHKSVTANCVVIQPASPTLAYISLRIDIIGCDANTILNYKLYTIQ